jgi:Zn-dependent peptidase ImmA (M78 family)
VTLRRGFLAEAEREAKRIRAELGLGPGEPVDVSQIAKHLGIRVIAADELIDAARLHDLERVQAFAFSACTFDIDGTKVIVVNPLRTPARRASDIAHELAHLLLAHQLDEIRSVGGVPFRTCRPDQEEEATNLGGTLLLPRPLLLSAVRCGLDDQAIAAQYDVTTEMARFRVNRTGVRRQLRSTRQRRDTGAST